LELPKKARLRDKKSRRQMDPLLEDKFRDLYLANEELQIKCQELGRHSEELELFLSLSPFSQGSQDVNTVLQFFVNSICKLQKWPAGHVFVFKEGNDKLLVSSGIWYFDSEKDYHELHDVTSAMTFKIGESLPGITLATENQLYIEDVQNDPQYFRSRVCRKLGIHSSFGIPLKCNNKVLAVVEFFIFETLNKDDKAFDLIGNFVQQLEGVLERQRAQEEARESNIKLNLANEELRKKYQELKKHSAELELFLSLAQLSQGTQELNSVLRFFVNSICKLEKWPAGHVFVLKPGSDTELVSADIWYFDNDKDYHELYDITSTMTFKLGESLPGITLATEKPLYLEDIQNDPDYFRSKVCKKLEIHSSFGIPIKCNNKVLAVVEFFILSPVNQVDKAFDLIGNFVKQLEGVLERQRAQEDARESNVQLQQAFIEVQEMAHHDSLTQLPNRRQFELTLTRYIARSKRNDKKLALFTIDLDNFKVINDRLGHDIGDLLLVEIGKRLQTNIGTEDFISHLGGDEFAIILQNSSVKEAEIVAEKLLHNLNEPVKIDSNDISISVSIGIACFPDMGSDYVTLYKNADIAMYKAKEVGRNTYKYFDVSLGSQYKKRLEIENHIEFALEKGEFFLVYQPIYTLTSQKIFGLEVLLRWQHPEYDLLFPEEFIFIAEEKGTIVPIGEWILREACQQYMEWRREINSDCKLFVNISPRQLEDKNFFINVIKTISKSGMPCGSLEFEITETALMGKQEETQEILKRVSNLGIKIAIDDFGTGYSSFDRLKSLPISALKIDKSFIQDIGAENNNDLIVKSIISLAKTLNLQAIAEGVEEKAQLDFLLENECSEGQGYYFNHPLTKEEMKLVLLKSKA